MPNVPGYQNDAIVSALARLAGQGDVLWADDQVEGGNSEDDTRQGDKL